MKGINIEFEDVDKLHLDEYVTLESATDLSPFLSRTRPNNFESQSDKTLFWKYIKFNNRKIGALWLEKNSMHTNVATLGIFIANDIYRSKGLGATAIIMAIEKSQPILLYSMIELRVRATNDSAINCYKKCGFQETDKFIKDDGNNQYEVLHMLYSL